MIDDRGAELVRAARWAVEALQPDVKTIRSVDVAQLLTEKAEEHVRQVGLGLVRLVDAAGGRVDHRSLFEAAVHGEPDTALIAFLSEAAERVEREGLIEIGDDEIALTDIGRSWVEG